MNINRHNYEEYLLMYVDNELSAGERTAVEAFVAQHSDLQAELDMLLQTVLPPAEIAPFDKSLLFKTEEGISLSNYEEYFLLYVDNELTGNDANEVERFVLKHPELQDQFILLQQTRLQPETWEFAHKEILYKQAARPRVVALRLPRLAVAAALMGIACATWFTLQDNQTTPVSQPVQELHANNNTATQVDHAGQPAANVTPASQQAAGKGLQPAATVIQAVAQLDNNVKRQPVTIPAKPIQPEVNETDRSPVHNANQLPAPKFNPNLALQPPVEMIEDAGQATTAKEPTGNPHSYAAAQPQTATAEPLVHTAVYTETEPADDQTAIYIGGARINKNKLRGLLKKAAGLFENGQEPSNDQKVLHIAAFSIKSK